MENKEKLQFREKALKYLLENNEDIGGEGFDSVTLNRILTYSEVMNLLKKEDSYNFGLVSLMNLLNRNDRIELYDCIWNDEKTGYIPALGLPHYIFATKEGCTFTSGAPFLL